MRYFLIPVLVLSLIGCSSIDKKDLISVGIQVSIQKLISRDTEEGSEKYCSRAEDVLEASEHFSLVLDGNSELHALKLILSNYIIHKGYTQETAMIITEIFVKGVEAAFDKSIERLSPSQIVDGKNLFRKIGLNAEHALTNC
jgi:hypothetical protein